jgi:hypothetical protein
MKGILFSTPMVAAINEDRKTMTRREVKYNKKIQDPQTGFSIFTEKGEFSVRGIHESGDYRESFFKLPYQPGDILYVREEHCVTLGAFNDWIVEYKDGSILVFQEAELPADTIKRLNARKTLGKWQRGRFLPKALARTFLKVTAVKAERLNDISEADAIAEGVEFIEGTGWKDYVGYYTNSWVSAKASFSTLWVFINGHESWNKNPYVFAYTFERTQKPS